MIFRKLSDYLGHLSLHAPCPRCEAKVGQRCTTMSGKTTKTHVPRYEPLLEAYNAGYQDALNGFSAKS